MAPLDSRYTKVGFNLISAQVCQGLYLVIWKLAGELKTSSLHGIVHRTLNSFAHLPVIISFLRFVKILRSMRHWTTPCMVPNCESSPRVKSIMKNRMAQRLPAGNWLTASAKAIDYFLLIFFCWKYWLHCLRTQMYPSTYHTYKIMPDAIKLSQSLICKIWQGNFWHNCHIMYSGSQQNLNSVIKEGSPCLG